jgi:excisionase family DNA binding protein
MEKGFLDTKEAAEFLGYHRESLLRILREQPQLGIPHKRVGVGRRARYRFSKEKLKEWIEREVSVSKILRRVG